MLVQQYCSTQRIFLSAVLRTRVMSDDTLIWRYLSIVWKSRLARRKIHWMRETEVIQRQTWYIRRSGGRTGEGGAVAERGGGGGEIVWWWWSVAALRLLLVLPSRRLRSTAKWYRSTALAVVVSVAVLVVVVAQQRVQLPRASRTIAVAVPIIITTTIIIMERLATIMTDTESRIAPVRPLRAQVTSSAVRTKTFPPALVLPDLGNHRRRPSPRRDRTCYRYIHRTITSSIRRRIITSSWMYLFPWSMVSKNAKMFVSLSRIESDYSRRFNVPFSSHAFFFIIFFSHGSSTIII